MPWVQPVTLSEVVAAPRYEKVEREGLSYPAEQRAAQLSQRYLQSVRSLKHRIDALVDILPPGDPQARAFDIGVLRLLSSAWRGEPRLAAARLTDLTNQVERTMDKVYIASTEGSLVTLTSKRDGPGNRRQRPRHRRARRACG